MSAPDRWTADLQRFAAALRQLRAGGGNPSSRALAKNTFFSHTTIADAFKGRQLPSLDATLAIVRACGGDEESWAARWHELKEAEKAGEAAAAIPAAAAASPWGSVPVVDGADPDQAGCSRDAETVGAARIALRGQRRIVGMIELRYSPSGRAGWGRFHGYPLLNHLAATRDDVIVVVDVVREADGRRAPFRECYSFDYHWCDLLTTGRGLFYACATIHFGEELVAYQETERVRLD